MLGRVIIESAFAPTRKLLYFMSADVTETLKCPLAGTICLRVRPFAWPSFRIFSSAFVKGLLFFALLTSYESGSFSSSSWPFLWSKALLGALRRERSRHGPHVSSPSNSASGRLCLQVVHHWWSGGGLAMLQSSQMIAPRGLPGVHYLKRFQPENGTEQLVHFFCRAP